MWWRALRKLGEKDCRLLVSLRQDQSEDSTRRTVDWILSNRHPRLLNLFVDGDESLTQDSNQRFGPLLFLRTDLIPVKTQRTE